MSTEFDAAIRKAERQLTEATDSYHRYKKLYLQWQDEVNLCQRVLNRLQEAAGLFVERYTADDDQRDDAPVAAATEAIPAMTVKAAVKAPHPVAVGANGFDRHAAKRELWRWHIHYPLPYSYQALSQMTRQAITTELCQHPDYKDKWLGNGGPALTRNGLRVNMDTLEEAATILGVDTLAIADRVRALQADILTNGRPGADYATAPLGRDV